MKDIPYIERITKALETISPKVMTQYRDYDITEYNEITTETFTQELLAFNGEKIDKIIINNPSGNSIITGGNSEMTKVGIQLLYTQQEMADKLIKSNKFITLKGTTLYIDLQMNPLFEDHKIMTNLTLDLPYRTEISLKNKLGDTIIKNIHSNIFINQYFGRLFCSNIKGIISGKIDKSKLSSIDNFDILDLEVTDSLFRLSKGDTIRLQAKGSNLKIEEIRSKTTINSSRESINLKSIQGDITLISFASSIELQDIKAKILKIENSFEDINLKEISAGKIFIKSSNNKVHLSLLELSNQLMIEGKDSNITLAYPDSLKPSYNIDIKYGKIIFNRDEEVKIKASSVFSSLKTIDPPKPHILINNSYGDIYLEKL